MVNKNPLIQGVTITPRNLILPKARFLSEDEVGHYQETIKSKYGHNPRAFDSLNVLSFDKGLGEPVGSNFWVLVQLESMGITPASATTLDILAETNPDLLSGHYEDISKLTLRSRNDSYKKNNQIIQYLLPQIKKRLKGQFKFPILIGKDLGLITAQNEYGLSLKLGEQTEIIYAPEFAYTNNKKRFSRLDEREIPIFDKEGTRTFDVKPDGLSGLYFQGGLGLGSDCGGLASSFFDGRVVVESSEVTS